MTFDRRSVWILPLAIFVLVLLGYPLALSVVYSVSDVGFQTIREPKLIGFANYRAVLTQPAFWGSFWFSVRFAVAATVIQIGLALALALILEPLVRRYKTLLVLLLLPLMVAPVLMGIMYRLLLNDFVGMITQYLRMLGLSVSLLNPPWVYGTVVAIEILQWTPFAFLILFAALQAIPDTLLSAATIDGASSGQILRRIVLPLLIPSISIAAFIRFVDSFRVFDHIFVLTGGGPGRQTTSLSIYIYRAFFQQERIGAAVAAAMIMLALSIVPLSVSMRRIIREQRL
ncbi:MAG: sugar ABC transporter permease [Spirochaetales bacterium]|nr:sugar ABC transporter permease [Spirochaetales bacterium]